MICYISNRMAVRFDAGSLFAYKPARSKWVWGIGDVPQKTGIGVYQSKKMNEIVIIAMQCLADCIRIGFAGVVALAIVREIQKPGH